jgi:hypothetical protein
MQCTYNVTESRARNRCSSGKTISITYSEFASIALGYPECNAHASYWHLSSVRVCNILPHCLTNSTIFEKKKCGHKMCVLIFSTTFV